MAINNLNPRRTVWFSPNEPSNKYDIWLSKNAHYDENEEPTIDSPYQRGCDYIFKIYDCGKWNPIVGFNTTAANKIDTVTGVDYTIDGVTHSGKNVYHPAIFTAESPNELYDAGSLGELLKDTHFVTEGDWNDIYNEYIKTIIEQYPFDLWPAEQNELGGIFADRFASTHIDSTAANKTWMAQCKYKYNASSNYNLYVHARDIISAVNDYQTDHPNEPGINTGGDISIETLQGLFKNTATLEREVIFNSNNHPIVKDNIWGAGSSASGNAGKLLKLKDTLQDQTEYTALNNFIEWVSPDELFGEIIVDPIVLYRSFYNSPTILKGWTDDQNQAQKPRFELAGARTLQNRGKLLMLKPADDPFWSNGPSEYDEASNANALNWVSPDDLFGEYSYELPLASLGALGGIRAAAHASFPVPHTVECKLGTNLAFAQNAQYKKQALHIDVKDVKNALDEWYAENDSTEWDLNLKASYGVVVRKETFTDDDNNQIVSYTHSLSNYGQFTQEGLYCRTKFYNQSTPGVQNRDYSYNDTHGLEWVGAQSIVEEGLGISGGEGYLYYDGRFGLMSAPGGGGGDPYRVLGSNNYTEEGNYVIGVPSGGTGGATRYLNGLGSWSVPTINVPTFSGASPGLVPQSTQQTRDKYLKGDGTWGTPTVSAEFDIDMDSQAVSDDYNFTLSNTSLTSNNTVSPVNKTLREWYYYEINCGNKTTQFTFSNTHVSGNAIYIRINTAAASVGINTDADIIFSNEVMSSSRRQFAANSSYLITIQFGIIKIEKITVDSSQENV